MIGLVLAAAGSGARFGSETPKQFAEIEGRPVFVHALQPFLEVCSQAVVVVPRRHIPLAESHLAASKGSCRLQAAAGGKRRQDSVLLGLQRLGEDIRIVLVHDAARPYCSSDLISRVVEGARRHGACIPILPIADTVKQIEEGRVTCTLDRSQLGLAQTPQGFERRLLLRAFEETSLLGFEATDESSLLEHLGIPVYTVPGERANLKITWREDL